MATPGRVPFRLYKRPFWRSHYLCVCKKCDSVFTKKLWDELAEIDCELFGECEEVSRQIGWHHLAQVVNWTVAEYEFEIQRREETFSNCGVGCIITENQTVRMDFEQRGDLHPVTTSLHGAFIFGMLCRHIGYYIGPRPEEEVIPGTHVHLPRVRLFWRDPRYDAGFAMEEPTMAIKHLWGQRYVSEVPVSYAHFADPPATAGRWAFWQPQNTDNSVEFRWAHRFCGMHDTTVRCVCSHCTRWDYKPYFVVLQRNGIAVPAGKVTWSLLLKILSLMQTMLGKIHTPHSLAMMAAARVCHRDDYDTWRSRFSHHPGLSDIFGQVEWDQFFTLDGTMDSPSYVQPKEHDIYAVAQILSLFFFHRGMYLMYV